MIVGGRIIKVTGQRLSENPFTGLSVNVNVNKMERRDKFLIITYTHHIDYKDNVAAMDIEGELVYEDTESALKDIESEWKKKGDLPKDLAESILNSVNHTGTAIGTLLSFAINVQAPVVTSKLSIGETKNKGKAG